MKLYRRYSAGNIILALLSIIIAVIFLFPLVFGLFASLKPESASSKHFIDWFKPPYTLANYAYILGKSSVPMWTFNSFLIAILSTGLGLAVSALVGSQYFACE